MPRQRKSSVDESANTDLDGVPADSIQRHNVPERRDDARTFHRDYIVAATEEQVDTDTEGRLVAATRQHAINSGVRPTGKARIVGVNKVDGGVRVEVAVPVVASGAEGVEPVVEHAHVSPSDQRAAEAAERNDDLPASPFVAVSTQAEEDQARYRSEA